MSDMSTLSVLHYLREPRLILPTSRFEQSIFRNLSTDDDCLQHHEEIAFLSVNTVNGEIVPI